MDVDNLISGSSAFSKSSLNIWKFTVHVLLKLGLENFEHYFPSMSKLCGSLNVLWHCLSLGLEWKLTFSSPMTTAEFSKFAGIYWGNDSPLQYSYLENSMKRGIPAWWAAVHWSHKELDMTDRLTLLLHLQCILTTVGFQKNADLSQSSNLIMRSLWAGVYNVIGRNVFMAQDQSPYACVVVEVGLFKSTVWITIKFYHPPACDLGQLT